MLLNNTNRRNCELLCQRTDIPAAYMEALDNAKLFMEFAEKYFIRDTFDFFVACDKALMELSDSLRQIGKRLDVNAMIPMVYKFWMYNREFEGWLKDTDNESLLLINI